MMCGDPNLFLELKRQDLLEEAKRERLAAQVPRARSMVRHTLAVACHRAANWLDDPKRYFQPTETGPVDWVSTR